ncbi:hypothetical protein OG946_17000 [Streptomyces sp. NBC_01808]|uniref:hypothetical protein n=1 Tax=Streptomyces sp. NBC_01808 TaxID=2975947 RepID=UPI002DDC0C13|nr:hypothetical protein [Streptomyces sp. NBC_01808]WSA38917.1 hypothetical protein OG946_17000 [Streptomyces sp. NBC_01808]
MIILLGFGSLWLWNDDPDTGSREPARPAHGDPADSWKIRDTLDPAAVNSVTFSPDGKTLAAGTNKSDDSDFDGDGEFDADDDTDGNGDGSVAPVGSVRLWGAT